MELSSTIKASKTVGEIISFYLKYQPIWSSKSFLWLFLLSAGESNYFPLIYLAWFNTNLFLALLLSWQRRKRGLQLWLMLGKDATLVVLIGARLDVGPSKQREESKGTANILKLMKSWYMYLHFKFQKAKIKTQGFSKCLIFHLLDGLWISLHYNCRLSCDMRDLCPWLVFQTAVFDGAAFSLWCKLWGEELWEMINHFKYGSNWDSCA